jgi:hypothetical protein
MRQHELAAARSPAGPLVSPWPVLLTGLGLTLLGWIWGLLADESAPGLRVLVLAAGLVGIGSALALYVPHAGAGLEARLISAGLWLLAAAAAYLARMGLGTYFDSLIVLLQALTIAAVIVAILTALPRRWRLLGGTVLLLLHFGAIFTAATVVPPPNGMPPYLANQLWARLTRPYLQLTLLNNGYHFYAPEPGPAALLWFRLEFEDGSSRWVRLPDHRTCRNHHERRRWGALATVIGQSIQPSPERLDRLLQKRIQAGKARGIPMADLPLGRQYRETTRNSEHLIASYVRRVARTTEHPEGLEKPVVAVKVYFVEYFNPPVEHFQAGRDPLDPTLYMAYYQGEYDREGKLKQEDDPFLHWLIPIIRVPERPGVQPEVGPSRHEGEPSMWSSEGKVINYVRLHAGDPDGEDLP